MPILKQISSINYKKKRSFHRLLKMKNILRGKVKKDLTDKTIMKVKEEVTENLMTSMEQEMIDHGVIDRVEIKRDLTSLWYYQKSNSLRKLRKWD